MLEVVLTLNIVLILELPIYVVMYTTLTLELSMMY